MTVATPRLRPIARFPDLRPLIFPKSAVLVGVSERTSPGIVESVVGKGIPVFGVHPRRPAIAGLEMFARIAELPARPELALLLVGHRAIERAIDEALDAGVRAFIIPGLGNEAAAEAAPVTARVADRLRLAGAMAVGPNGMGVAVPSTASFWFGTVPATFVPGHVSVIVHSGSIGEALLALGPRIGFRAVVSPGAEIGADVADFCAYFAGDDGTRAVGLFLETVRRPEAFDDALALLGRSGKPVVCLKVGRSPAGAAAVLAHNGARPGSQAALDRQLHDHHVIVVDDYPAFLEVLEVLGRQRRPLGARLGGVSNSGGEAALLADHADDAGMPFRPLSGGLIGRLKQAFPNYAAPQNPVDAWAVDEPERVFPETLQLLAQSGEFDILVAQIDQSQFLGAPENDNALFITRALADAVAGTSIFAAVTSVQPGDPSPEVARLARDRDVALLRGSQNAMRALAAVARLSTSSSPSPYAGGPTSPSPAGGGGQGGGLHG
jgi:acyl-CoA synthetase (NDP forming)